jgi:predicted exporter
VTIAGRNAFLIWLAGLAACALLVARGHFTADMSAFLPQRPSASQEVLVEQLREGSLSRLLLIGLEGGDAAARARLSKALAPRLVASNLFAGVQNGDAAAFARDREILFGNRYLLSPGVTPERFSAAGLRQSIGDSIDLLASPAGLMIKALLPRDPTGELVELIGAFEGRDKPASANGVWASRDGQRALLIAQTLASGSDTDGQAAAVARVRSEFAAVAADNPEVRLLVSGAPIFSLAARATIKSEVERLAIISAVGIVVVLLLAYRSITALVLGLLPVLSGALAGVAAVMLGFGSVHGITIGFGTTLIGEAVDYSIYYFVQSGTGSDADWRARFWPTVRLGVLTSVCGFASMFFSGFPGLAQLGLYSISGLIAAALVTRFVLPQLRPASFAIRDTSALGRRAIPLVRRLGALRWLIAMLAVAALTVVVAKRDRLWNEHLSDLSPMPPAILALDASLRADLGGNTEQGYLVVLRAGSREAALQAAERVGDRLQPLVDAGRLGGFESPARFLPSEKAQAARRAALPERAELATRLRVAMRDLPLRAEKLNGFLDDVAAARAGPLLTADALKGSSIGIAIDTMLQQRGGRWMVLMPVHGTAAGFDEAAVRGALAGEADALFLDLGEESTRLYADYLHEIIWLSLAGVAAIALLLAATLRSLRRTLRVMAPLVLAVLLVMAGLALAGERMTLMHLVGLLLTVAVGSNYALFFDDGKAASDPQTLASLLVANTTTVIGFGALATASVPVLHAIGVTVGPGAVLALLFSAVLAAPRDRS